MSSTLSSRSASTKRGLEKIEVGSPLQGEGKRIHAVNRIGSYGPISHCGHRMIVDEEVVRIDFILDRLSCKQCVHRECLIQDGKS